jgi:hypothetical protein
VRRRKPVDPDHVDVTVSELIEYGAANRTQPYHDDIGFAFHLHRFAIISP